MRLYKKGQYGGQQQGTAGARIVMGVIAIIAILALFEQPHFVFATYQWSGTIINKFWYIIGKAVFLGLAGFCGYIAVMGTEQ